MQFRAVLEMVVPSSLFPLLLSFLLRLQFTAMSETHRLKGEEEGGEAWEKNNLPLCVSF